MSEVQQQLTMRGSRLKRLYNIRKALYDKKSKRARRCIRCGTVKAVIRKYGLYICRRCFREVYHLIGFKKSSIHRS